MKERWVAGIDVGSSAVKAALFRMQGETQELVACHQARIRRRDIETVVEGVFSDLLTEAGGPGREDLAYIASTGEGEQVRFATGHFYGMTTHSRGALYLMPAARAVLDMGALHTRAMIVDERSKVLRSRMTSQCASGTGQFLENISRYLGITIEEVADLSKQAKQPEQVSTICAVLAETDVINMVSRGISTQDILRGIHESMASRVVKLLRVLKADTALAVTGGLAADHGLAEVMGHQLEKSGRPMAILTHEYSPHAGAIGAALWGAFRHQKLLEKEIVVA